jgi:hypothetical protein
VGQEVGDNPFGERSMLAADGGMDEAAEARNFCRCVGETDSPSVDRIEAALPTPLRTSGLSFIDTPLEEVVSLLQSDYDIPIQLDMPALDEIGLGPDEQVTIELHNISLRSALRLMLKTMQLTYVIRDEVLLITTPEAAEAELATCVYDIRGLIDEANEKSPKTLVDTIISCVATETWAANGGGEAEIRSLQPGLLVISQTRAVHEEVQGLLAAIRDVRRQPVPAEAAAPRPADADRLVTRSYTLHVTRAADSDEVRAQVRELIVQAMPDQRWNGRLENGQPVVLTVLPDRIVVRHTQSVQDALQTLLADSGVAVVQPEGTSGVAGRDFGGRMGGKGGGFFQPAPASRE